MYEYLCPNGHRQEKVVLRLEDAPENMICSCGCESRRQFGMPNFKLGWVPTVNDTGKAWEGTPLEDSDTANKLTFKSKKMFFDNARKTEVNGVTKPRPTRGVAALGQ